MNMLASVPPIALLVAGFVVCFFGYRLIRLTLGLAGFGMGLALGLTITGLLPHVSQVLTIVVGIVCGILGALAATLLYKLGVFVLGAGAGALVAGAVILATGWHHPVLIQIVAAIIGGILTLLLERPLVSILSALAGGWGIAAGAFRLLGWGHPAGESRQPTTYGIMVACWLILALIGTGVQLRSRGKRKKQPPARTEQRGRAV
jgi:hypothetical protein